MGDVLSEILKTELFAVTEDGNSEKSEKNSFTVYPREKPTQSEKIGCGSTSGPMDSMEPGTRRVRAS